MNDLDKLDRKILSELDRDSRQPYSRMARKLRMNKDTLKYRITQLIENGVIQGFYTVIDYSKLGLLSFRFYFQLSSISHAQRRALIDYLKAHPNISIFYRITGRYHFSFSMWAHDPWEYETFWQDFGGKFGAYISDSHLAIKTSYTEFSRSYLAEKSPNTEEKTGFAVFQKTKREDLDPLDMKILRILSANARTPLIEIAKTAGTSMVTCRARMKKLLKNRVIVGFRTMLDLEKLGCHYYKVDLWFSPDAPRQKFTQNVLGHPYVIFTEKTVLTSDFEFDLEVHDFSHFVEIMDGFEQAFPNAIKRYEYYTLVENYKTNYLPMLR